MWDTDRLREYIRNKFPGRNIMILCMFIELNKLNGEALLELEEEIDLEFALFFPQLDSFA